MDLHRTWFTIKKKAKKTYKKVRRAIKKYIRFLVRHTKAGDYSVLIYSVLAVLILILFFVLIGKLFSGGHKKDKIKENAPVEVTTEDKIMATESYETILAGQCKTVYNNNQDLLVLVNVNNPLDENYTFEHHALKNGKEIDQRIYNDLKNMLEACNEAGNEYNIVSAYRDRAYQQGLIDEDVQKYVNQGMTADEAYAETIKAVQPAGCSEHETGLALDISSPGVTSLEEYLADNPTNAWLMENSYKYGFVLRYPSDKVAVTGIDYEPWHFRYVGIEAATFLHDNNLTLEEFHELVLR